MNVEPIDGPSAPNSGDENGYTNCRKHRRISDLEWGVAIAESGLFGTKAPGVAAYLGDQLCSCIWVPDDLTPDEIKKKILVVIALVESLIPRDELDAMLAVQAVSVHNAAMECLRRAMVPNEFAPVCDLYLKHTTKLCQAFVSQVQVMNRNKRNPGT